MSKRTLTQNEGNGNVFFETRFADLYSDVWWGSIEPNAPFSASSLYGGVLSVIRRHPFC